MPNVEVQLPAAIGAHVLIHSETLTGQAALVVAWRAVRHRLLRGGTQDPTSEVSLLVITAKGDEHWVYTDEVTGFGAPTMMVVFLPFLAGDRVLVARQRRPHEREHAQHAEQTAPGPPGREGAHQTIEAARVQRAAPSRTGWH